MMWSFGRNPKRSTASFKPVVLKPNAEAVRSAAFGTVSVKQKSLKRERKRFIIDPIWECNPKVLDGIRKENGSRRSGCLPHPRPFQRPKRSPGVRERALGLAIVEAAGFQQIRLHN